MKQLKVLELFAGTRSIGKEFDKKGHLVYSVEWDKAHENINWYTDIGKITTQDIVSKFGIPDVIWASPDCTSYSVAGISHHRRKDEDGNLTPISEYAKFCDDVNKNLIKIIDELLLLNPNLIYFIENPRGGMRKMNFIKDKPRYTLSYCQYGDKRQKPTDIWTNHKNPKFKPICKPGSSCHEAAPRGSRTGTQGIKGSKDRSRIPEQLCRHISDICEEGFEDVIDIKYIVNELIENAKRSTTEGNWIYDVESIEKWFDIKLNKLIINRIKDLLEENEDIADVQLYDDCIDVMLYQDSF